MSDVTTNQYGYHDDETKASPFVFGLNAGVCFLTKFAYTPTGGKDGAEQEALDIVFTINGTDKSYRMFPVTKVYGKNNEEITDPKNKEFIKAVDDWNARITHIMHCFVDKDVYKASISVPQNDSFKAFCQIAASVLPKDFATKPLDIFLQYQWQPSSGQTKTYLEIPKKMSYGKWLTPAQPGTWDEVIEDKFNDKTTVVLQYGKQETAKRNEEGDIIGYTEFHPITKNGWFMLSNFAKQQQGNSSSSSVVRQNTTQADAAIAGQTPTNPATRADAW